jgi:transcription antitermination factor NusG
MEILHIEGKLWTPIRTKPKKEKKLAEYCEANKIDYYLPLRRSVKRYGRKTVEFFPPMFGGYIFCLLDNDIFKLLVRSNAVFFSVKVDDILERQLIIDLNNIKIFEKISCRKEVIIKPELISGKEIQITNGPLSGISGIIQKRKSNIAVTVNIEMLGQSITVEVDMGDVEIEKS